MIRAQGACARGELSPPLPFPLPRPSALPEAGDHAAEFSRALGLAAAAGAVGVAAASWLLLLPLPQAAGLGGEPLPQGDADLLVDDGRAHEPPARQHAGLPRQQPHGAHLVERRAAVDRDAGRVLRPALLHERPQVVLGVQHREQPLLCDRRGVGLGFGLPILGNFLLLLVVVIAAAETRESPGCGGGEGREVFPRGAQEASCSGY